MSIDGIERIYAFVPWVAFGIAFLAALWIHRGFYGDALVERPESLSNGQLRQALAWGKILYRFNAGKPRGDDILHRMQLALEELRRRQTGPNSN